MTNLEVNEPGDVVAEDGTVLAHVVESDRAVRVRPNRRDRRRAGYRMSRWKTNQSHNRHALPHPMGGVAKPPKPPKAEPALADGVIDDWYDKGALPLASAPSVNDGPAEHVLSPAEWAELGNRYIQGHYGEEGDDDASQR